MILQLWRFLPVLASATLVSTFANELPVAVQDGARNLHVVDIPGFEDHIHDYHLTDLHENYYIWHPDYSMSFFEPPPTDHYYYYYYSKGKGKGKGKSKDKSKGKSKGKDKKSKKSKSGKAKKMKEKSYSYKDGKGDGYWYKHEHEHSATKGKGYELVKGKGKHHGYWYYYEEHEHEHVPHHGSGYHDVDVDDESFYKDAKGKSKSKSKTKGKGMNMGMRMVMGMKRQESKEKGQGYYPPHPVSEPPSPTMSPTLDSTGSPTPPRPTSSPTHPGRSVVVSPYRLNFSLSATSIPSVSELDALTQVTKTYLDEFLGTNFGTGPVLFDRAETVRAGFTDPAVVDFETTLFFFPAAIVPSTAELNNAIEVAFKNAPLLGYLNRVREINPPNVFRTVVNAQFSLTPEEDARLETNTTTPQAQQGPTPQDDPIPPLPIFPTQTARGGSGNDSGSELPLVAAAGAGAFVLVLAGYLLYKRNTEEVELAGKFIDADAHMTMTVAGDTYVGGQSTDSQTYAEGASTADFQSTSLPQQSFRSETPEWKEFHEGEKSMMSESEWNEYQEAVSKERGESPFETVPEETELNLPYGEDDDSFPERILNDMDDVTL